MLSTAIDRWKVDTRSYVYIDADEGMPVLPSSSQLATRGKAVWSKPQFITGMTMETCRDLNHQELGMPLYLQQPGHGEQLGARHAGGKRQPGTTGDVFWNSCPYWRKPDRTTLTASANEPVLVNPPDEYLRDTAERVPYEIGYSLLRTDQEPLTAAKQELDLSPATGASRWVTKWEGLTHRLP